MTEAQTTRTVLMVRPGAFAANEQTALSNHFQASARPADDLIERARLEFDAAVLTLRGAGVEVIVVNDSPHPAKPDAIFPNNWLTTHVDGTAVLYPMLAPNRRLERRHDVLDELRVDGFRISNVVDLSGLEDAGAYLEGTGSLILDRVHHVAYACRSPRTSESALQEFAQRMSYRTIVFDARDDQGRPIYHTNVMLSIGRRFAAACFECMSALDAERLRKQLRATGHELIELSFRQVQAFAGNMLELATVHGGCVAMSTTAQRALTHEQSAHLSELAGPIVAADIPTIEHYGGGSVRCMLAEVHLPRIADATR